ncbi:mandelate racemase/muconate lactonizing enzyme family protein [Limobrevibacterium gyesilva]|uniref:Mandelate racemase/muconate lactonizing enzyme family protein n=1 Tax=Limobrevibacterium gyesilva TaxID=2991712 RepID=A0AA42CIE4_9PROT|nr:mandelate racemase/muconate lactonizing enzyme family protein [Limobrevibacterium gyesilva]MCW3475847.1 mandelate racemase/muconate lactonizing enzyme family protein [Limobrevibacterium gyesilva]
MKITDVETIRLGEFPNLIWVRVRTDEGLVGLGETFMGAAAVEAYIHETAAPKLIGKNPLQIEARQADLRNYLGWRSAGVETRGNSAIDIALWDIFAKAAGMPLCDALGGRSRDSIRTYNTCAGYKYIRDARAQAVSNWHIGAQGGPYEDLDGFLHRADELALSLLDQGITGMKIWPFDIAAERSGGYDISPQELTVALEPFAKIRGAVGDRMDIMVEFHSLWSLPMACKLAERLAEFGTYWHEDPFRLDNIADLAEYRRHSKAWVCASETLSYTHAFREYLATGAAGVVMLDLSWCGGLSEARKIAGMAEAWHTPVAPHDCTGPVVYMASCHFSLFAQNALIQESVRAFYTGWYKELVTALPTMSGGMVTVDLTRPGLGTELLLGIDRREDAVVRATRSNGI